MAKEQLQEAKNKILENLGEAKSESGLGSGDSYRKDSMAGSSDDGEENERTGEGRAPSTVQGTEDDAKTKGTVRTICSSEQKRIEQEQAAQKLLG